MDSMGDVPMATMCVNSTKTLTSGSVIEYIGRYLQNYAMLVGIGECILQFRCYSRMILALILKPRSYLVLRPHCHT